MMNISISHRGATLPLSVLPDSTLEALQLQLEELTSVPPSLQKLLYKGKKKKSIQLLGTTEAELGGVRSAENERRRKEKVLRERATANLPKPRSTGRMSSSTHFGFSEIVPLPHLPAPESARERLSRLANDPAIKHVMSVHHYNVGTLTELAPHEQPQLLGLNVNHGEAIKLRLRTDAYDGFRLYADVRRVLCHELAHNVHGDHNDDFKALNSLLNKEVADFEHAQRTGAHTLGGNGPVYTPSASTRDLEIESEAQGHILGGSSPSVNDTREERRRRALDAAVNRLRREEAELEQSCGTAGPGHESESPS
ncbi:hypothetical protein EW145_g757 [Phellinidium pouzarii]|uniref:WLM domain-containing protein n=1 Tax=Phellinidium pouzarii TaxID=167371 RepID=A0A4S4LH29_9AGAM|nr:hypothetical protein EW145_g757 [Phellinidium pouzarii]